MKPELQAATMDDIQRYNNISIILHWLMAVLILCMFGLGWYMSDLPEGALKHFLFSLHKSTGITIFLLLLFRIYWRLTHPKPPLPLSMPLWQRRLANTVQTLMYVMLVVQPFTGYMSSSFSGYKTKFWGLPLPYWGWKQKSLNELFTNIHSVSAVILFSLVTLHICGVFAHFVYHGQDKILPRMLPTRRGYRSEAPVLQEKGP
jgi:cytochrome b561